LQPPSSFIKQNVTCKTKQQGLTKHNLLDLIFGIEQQKQNNTKLKGNEKKNLRLQTLLSFFNAAPQPQYQIFFPLAQPYEGGCSNLSCFWLFAYIYVYFYKCETSSWSNSKFQWVM
jgi:hypothetical protein